jgi:DNA-binding winged helix-turn-helix (wHTH) protein
MVSAQLPRRPDTLLDDERSFRGQGCTEACEVVRAIIPGRFGRSDLLLHDPQTHEAYGRATAVGVLAGDPIVWTGTLVIDRWARSVTSFGHDVYVTEREWQILDFLAARLGKLTSARELALAVCQTDWDGGHVVRVYISRLRRRLGASAALLETSLGRGYRLAALPPVMAQPEDEPPAPARPWALAFARCVCCGRTDRAHVGQGRCAACRPGDRRPIHIGPCGAPRPSDEEIER